jgi:hypothetical protein
MKDLTNFLTKARNIVRYYRVGPLGDVPSINGKLVEEAIRTVMVKQGLGKVTTHGLVDLGVAQWSAGFQVKTFRKKSKTFIFTRSAKKTKYGRIQDVKNRIVKSLKAVHVRDFYLLDVDTFTSDFTVYHLAKLLKNGKLRIFGDFLKSDNVWVNPKQTHFFVKKTGLKKVS